MLRQLLNRLYNPRPERWGIRYSRGKRETFGFLSRREAESWANSYIGPSFVAFSYDPIELRIDPRDRISEHPTVDATGD